ncbi:MAG: NAD(P)H-quinone oxidoreductase subunit F [Cyanobacteriota bacterium]|nr:NAD(P)H-quinone oxidoreductase subunit F [Cyanobacteriota bacterium]
MTSPPLVPALSLPIQLAWMIPLYGFSGVLLSLPWAAGWIKRNGPRPAAYLNLLLTLLAVVHGSLILRDVLSLGPQQIDWRWFQVADLDLRIGFDLSLTNLAALELVTFMSLVGQMFALGYLDKEWSLARFYALVGFFEGAMAGVVLSSNLFMTYFLLEMLTLSTYLLVGFWYAQPLVVTAARDAFLTKRVGDVLLLMSVVALAAWAPSLSFDALDQWSKTALQEGSISPLAGTLIGLGLIAGPMGKCAQFPMHLWLDEAMEGPNPASILRNSAVVTCGALVLVKVMPLLRLSPLAVTMLLVVGTISALAGALVAIAQVDLKRAFSYGTTSYLGLVFIAIGLQQPAIALLLLLAHGLAKALLFMSVGSVIATTNCQDITELGGLAQRMPATTSAYLIGGAALTGMAPLAGFWCLSRLVEALLPTHAFFAAVVLLTNTLTVFNLVRVYRQVFLDKPHPKTKRTPEVLWLMALPMVSLAVLVALLPAVIRRLEPYFDLGPVSSTAGLLMLASGVLGLVAELALPVSRFSSRSVVRPLRAIQDLLAADFYTDRLYRSTIVAFVAGLAKLTNGFDRQVINRLAERVGLASMATAEGLKLGVSGQLQSYVFTVITAIVILFVGLASLQVLR